MYASVGIFIHRYVCHIRKNEDAGDIDTYSHTSLEHTHKQISDVERNALCTPLRLTIHIYAVLYYALMRCVRVRI